MTETVSDIVKSFRDANFEVTEGEAETLLQLTITYNITSSDVVQRYDVCAMDREWDSSVTSSRVQKLSDALVSDPPAPEQSMITPTKSSPPLNFALQQDSRSLQLVTSTPFKVSSSDPIGTDPHTPETAKHTAAVLLESSSAKKPRLQSAFKNRTKVGEAQTSLNKYLESETLATPKREGKPVTTSSPHVILPDGHLESGQRFGVDPLNARASYLEGRILQGEAAFATIGYGACQPTGAPSQESVLCAGRICSEAEDGRLTESNVILEGSAATSDGARVPLDLSRVASFRVFTGQVVAVLATNPSGKRLLATQLHAAPPFLQSSLKPHIIHPSPLTADWRSDGGSASGEGCSIALAAGPFTTTADCDYEPLHELLSTLRSGEVAPAAVILVGPFLDETHPQVALGNLTDTFQHVFEAQVLRPVCDWATDFASTRVILVPSSRDAMAEPVFPTPPLQMPSFMPDNITMLSNPTTFNLEQVTYGIVSSDIIKALAATELTRPAVQGDRMISLASHVVAQRSYYPVYPAPRGALLDTSLAARHLDMTITPHVLVVPSDLAPFVKLLPPPDFLLAPTNKSTEAETAQAKNGQGTIVVLNPGRLAKGVAGGTWAHLTIAPAASLQSDGSPVLERKGCDVHSRCRVDILRI